VPSEIIHQPETGQAPLTTADLLRSNEEMPRTAATNGAHDPLFPAPEMDDFRRRWKDVQGGFVDEPKHAVEEADQLVASVIKRLTEVFASERSKLENEWGKGGDVSTEDFRQALRRYRSFFDRLLSV